MKDLADNYIERHGYKKRLSSLQGDLALLKNVVLPILGRLKVLHVTRQDIESLHKNFQSTPYKANHSLRLLSKMFNLAISWGWRDDNPVRGVPKYQEEKRDRWLNDEELNRLWEVLESHSNRMTAHVLKFLILTGARKGEALGAT